MLIVENNLPNFNISDNFLCKTISVHNTFCETTHFKTKCLVKCAILITIICICTIVMFSMFNIQSCFLITTTSNMIYIHIHYIQKFSDKYLNHSIQTAFYSILIRLQWIWELQTSQCFAVHIVGAGKTFTTTKWE